MTERLLKADQVAERLNIGRSTAFALMQRRDLPTVVIGRSVRVPESALERWVQDRTEVRSAARPAAA